MNVRDLAVLAIAAAALSACTDRSAPNAASGAAPPADAKAGVGAAGSWRAPRTSWGDPLLEGTYTNKDENNTPFERPADLDGKKLGDFGTAELTALNERRQELARERAPGIGGAETGAGPPHWYEHLNAVNSQAWLVTEPADGKIPALTEDGRRRADAQRASLARHEQPDSYTDMNLYDRCITRGMPGSMMPVIYGNSYDITQAPGYVTIRYEMIHEARVIALGDAPHVSGSVRSYMGDARGRWDGDTLVVETKNFRAGAGAGYRNSSEQLTVTERFTPVDEHTLRWEVRLEDPATWVAPWSFAMPLKRDASQPPFEYACHEGNRGLANILSAARAAEHRR